MDPYRRALTEDESKFNSDLKKLIESKPQMVEDFQKPAVKDLPVEKIDTTTRQPIKSGGDFLADQVIRDAKNEALRELAGKPAGDILDYRVLKKQFADKAKDFARSSAGRKALGAVPFVAPAMALLNGQPAQAAEELAADASPVFDAIRPEPTGPAAGTLDSRIEKGTLTDNDKALLRQQALQQLRK